jgi:hypothetical protein
LNDQAEFLRMSRRELDAIYSRSPAGEMPNGEARGLAIVGFGEPWNGLFAALTRSIAWQGKIFDAVRGRLTNRITPFGIAAVTADVYKGCSRFDGRECIVIDYSKTSAVAWWIRDEIREVAPSLYLGFAYCGKRRLIAFSLHFAEERRTLPLTVTRPGRAT